MWTYEVITGKLTHDDALIGIGYSGHEQGLNSVDHEQDHDIGPIPRGQWTIERFFDDPGGKGLLVAHLTPMEDTNVFARSGFMIHGDNEHLNHSASHGCVILGRTYRDQIMASSDRTLTVI